MKTLRSFFILTATLCCLYACKKDANTSSNPLAGKWNIVSVSTDGKKYTGQPGDYFDFTASGALDIKQGASVGAVHYSIAEDTVLTLNFPANADALPEWGNITTLTAHSLQIDGLYPVSPGGQITVGNSIILSR